MYILALGGNHHTLQERMLPNALKVSYKALLSIDLSRFLIKMLPTPERRRDGSRWLHMIRIGRPRSTSKFIVSKARSAVCVVGEPTVCVCVREGRGGGLPSAGC